VITNQRTDGGASGKGGKDGKKLGNSGVDLSG
jgi:hypothetical protein